MFTSDILYIYIFSFIIKSSICCISFCFVAWQDIYFIFAHDLAKIFISKEKISFRSLSESNGHPIRDTRADPEGTCPLFVLGYRLVKTYFNRIFPISSLSLFFLPCLVIFALIYVSVSFDISIKKNGFWNKTDPPYGNVWIRLWDTCTLVHCRTLWSVVNLWRRYNDLCCRLCTIFCSRE
jgi:hypothetical protein